MYNREILGALWESFPQNPYSRVLKNSSSVSKLEAWSSKLKPGNSILDWRKHQGWGSSFDLRLWTYFCPVLYFQQRDCCNVDKPFLSYFHQMSWLKKIPGKIILSLFYFIAVKNSMLKVVLYKYSKHNFFSQRDLPWIVTYQILLFTSYCSLSWDNSPWMQSLWYNQQTPDLFLFL